MATIIDALVVTLGLQPEGFNRGRGEVSDGLKKSREEAGKTGKDFEVFGKRAGDFFGKLRNEAVGLFLAFQGASSVTSFVTDLITGDAATGRLAKNIGMATQELSAWQLAVKSVGGDSKDADQALSSMAEALQSFRLTGTTGHDADLKGLGVTLADLQNPAEALMKMAEASERMDRTEFYARLTRIGIPPNVINMLAQGRAGLEKLIEEKKKDGAASEENAEAAAQLQLRLAELSAKLMGMVRPAIYAVAGALLDFLDGVSKGTIQVPDLNLVLVALLATALLLGAPFVAVAAAIALAINNLDWFARRWVDIQRMYAKGALDSGGWLPGSGELYKTMQEKGITTHEQIDAILPYPTGAPSAPSGANDNGAGGGAPVGGNAWDVARSGSGTGLMNANAGRIGGALLRAGIKPHVVRGILAGIHAESGGDPNIRNPTSGAFGIGQWLGPRKRALFARYGPNPTLDQQVAFLISELKGGDRGGAGVLASGSTEDALSNYIGGDNWGFMRPGAGRGGDMQRGRAALGLGGRGARPGAPPGSGGGSTSLTTSVGTINVYTAATDAEGIASELPGQLRRRGLITQANRGME